MTLRAGEPRVPAAEQQLRDELATQTGRSLGGLLKYGATGALSADGRWLATSSAQGAVLLWDLATADPVASPIILQRHISTIKRTLFSQDSRRLITFSTDATVRVWSLANPAAAPAIFRDVSDLLAWDTGRLRLLIKTSDGVLHV
jgi:WD40 repeat protein